MKQIISKILIILILLNGVFSLNVFGEEPSFKVYNNSVLAELVYPIETVSGKNYIAISDLEQFGFNTNYTNEKASINRNYYDYTSYASQLIAYLSSNIIRVDSISMLYYKPIISKENRAYVAIELFSMVFSNLYNIDETNKIINISVIDPNVKNISGKISLPNNEVAPVGGIEVTIFAGEISSVRNGDISSNIYDKGGFRGGYVQTKDDYNPYYKINNNSSVKITIPDGANSGAYSINYSSINNIGIGYTLETDKYTSGYYCGDETVASLYNKYPMLSFFDNIDMTIIPIKTITGTISLPNNEIAKEDINFKACAFGYYNYSEASGIINQGSNSAEYTIKIPGVDDSYQVKAECVNGEYANNVESIYKDVQLENINNVSDINIVFDYIKKISGKITLPNNIALDEDLKVKVIMQDREYPFNYICDENVTIPMGQKEIQYSLTAVNSVNSAIVFYRLDTSNSEIFDYGHYNSQGTVIEPNDSGYITFDNGFDVTEINIGMLQKSTIKVNLSLPNGMFADSNIYARGAYVLMRNSETGDVEFGNTHQEMDSQKVILEGENSGIIYIDVPRIVGVYNGISLNLYGDGRFYQYAYYNENATASNIEKSTPIDSSSDAVVNMALLRQSKISGEVTQTGVQGDNFEVYLFPQSSDTERNTMRSQVDFVSTNGGYNQSNYSFYVPSDVNKYIIGIRKWNNFRGIRYYTKNGLVENINEAEIINISNDIYIENINMEYTYFENITPVTIPNVYLPKLSTIIQTSIYFTSGFPMEVVYSGDFKRDNSTIYANFYDENNRLIATKAQKMNFEENSYNYVRMCLPQLNGKIPAKLKLFVWGEEAKPLAIPYEIE